MRRALLILSLILAAFAFSHAEPSEYAIEVDVPGEARIAEILKEVESGYGGTLVSAPKDTVTDSPAFVERYLRKFSAPEDLKGYDYRFERLLDRVSRFPESLNDPRLDEVVWDAYVALDSNERGWTLQYDGGGTVHVLDSSRDLLWFYLSLHAHDILKDPVRRTWWMNRLLASGTEIERLEHSFAALHLIDSTQKTVPELVVWDVLPESKIGSGRAGLDWFAKKFALQWTLWGCAVDELAAPVPAELPLKRWETKLGVDQESWSKNRSYFRASYYRPIGQKVRRFNVSMPRTLITDGIVMFYVKDRIHIWPKKDFFAGVLRMLEVAGVLQPQESVKYAEGLGITQIAITGQGGEK